MGSTNYAPEFSPDLVRLVVAQGFTDNTITAADPVKRGGEGFSASVMTESRRREAVLPPHLAKMGHLNTLMHRAAAYSEIVQHGELPLRGGVIKEAIAEKFLQTMQKRRDSLLLQGLSEQEAKEAMAQVGAEKLSAALRKVAVACRDQLNRYVKERAWERIQTIAERAMPKSEPGHRSHKGKMDTAHYKEMSAARRPSMMEENLRCRITARGRCERGRHRDPALLRSGCRAQR